MEVTWIPILLSIIAVSAAKNTQPNHSELTQKAQVRCSQSGTSYKLRFSLYKNTDTIEVVYTVGHVNRSEISFGKFDSEGNGIVGTGSSSSPFLLEITVQGDLDNGQPISLSNEDAQTTLAFVKGDDVLGIDIMAKSSYRAPFYGDFIFPNDVIYGAYCNFSLVSDKVASIAGGITIEGGVNEAPEIINESFKFEVLNSADLSPVTSGAISDMVKLMITPVSSPFATGVRVYNCDICDEAQCAGPTTLRVIGENGCSIGQLFTPFVRDGTSAVSGAFGLFVFQNGRNVLYITCHVSLCFNSTTGQQDTTCDESCVTSRRRRHARDVSDKDSPAVTTAIKITVNGDVLPDTLTNEKTQHPELLTQPDQEFIGLLAAVIALAGLIFVGLTVIVCFYIRRRKQAPPI